MSDDEIEALRERIWDYVYRSGEQSIESLVEHFGIGEEDIRRSIESDWFTVNGEMVLIATADS